jgi:hypothetical protein
LELDGKKVSAGTSADYVLANRITVFLRNDDPRAVDLGYEFASSLRARLIEDGMLSRTSVFNDLEKALGDRRK